MSLLVKVHYPCDRTTSPCSVTPKENLQPNILSRHQAFVHILVSFIVERLYNGMQSTSEGIRPSMLISSIDFVWEWTWSGVADGRSQDVPVTLESYLPLILLVVARVMDKNVLPWIILSPILQYWVSTNCLRIFMENGGNGRFSCTLSKTFTNSWSAFEYPTICILLLRILLFDPCMMLPWIISYWDPLELHAHLFPLLEIFLLFLLFINASSVS